MNAPDILIFCLLAAAAAFMLVQFDQDTMYVPLILTGILGYMYAARHTGLRFNPIFAAALVCLFGVCMAAYTWVLLVQGNDTPDVVSALLALAACAATGSRLVPDGIAACVALRHTGRPARV